MAQLMVVLLEEIFMRHDIRKDMNIPIAAYWCYIIAMIWAATRLITPLGGIFILSRIGWLMAQND